MFCKESNGGVEYNANKFLPKWSLLVNVLRLLAKGTRNGDNRTTREGRNIFSYFFVVVVVDGITYNTER